MALERDPAVSNHFLLLGFTGRVGFGVLYVSTWVAAAQRDRSQRIPLRGLAAAGVLALSLAAVLLPPAISVLVLLGWIR